MSQQKIVYCHCTYAKVIEAQQKNDVLNALLESGREFEAVPDLCEMSAQKDPQLKSLLEDGPVSVIACYHRAVKGLCHAADVQWHDDINVINMRENEAVTLVQELLNQEAQS